MSGSSPIAADGGFGPMDSDTEDEHESIDSSIVHEEVQVAEFIELADEGFGDDFDDFEAGVEAEDFGEFDEGIQQTQSPKFQTLRKEAQAPPLQSLPVPQIPFVSASHTTTA